MIFFECELVSRFRRARFGVGHARERDARGDARGRVRVGGNIASERTYLDV